MVEADFHRDVGRQRGAIGVECSDQFIAQRPGIDTVLLPDSDEQRPFAIEASDVELLSLAPANLGDIPDRQQPPVASADRHRAHRVEAAERAACVDIETALASLHRACGQIAPTRLHGIGDAGGGYPCLRQPVAVDGDAHFGPGGAVDGALADAGEDVDPVA